MKLLSSLVLLAATSIAFAGINPPTNLSATGIATNQISLTWTDTSSNEEGTYIERASSSTGPWTQIATASANATSYVNTGLSTATRYYYRARTFTRTRVTPYSAVATAITLSGGTAPTAPTSLTATAASSTQINLIWHAPTGTGVGGIATYRVYRAGVQIATTTSPTTNYNNTGLTLGTQYCYEVSAVDTAGNVSPHSSQACATTLGDTTRPTTPTGFTVNSASSSQINLAWTASTDSGGSGLVGYKVYRAGVQIATTTTTSYSNTGLAASAQYCYTVTAYDGAGNESFATPSLCATTGTPPDTTVPTAPTGTLATTNSSTVITVTWNASTDTGGSGLAGYKIIRDSVQIATVPASTLSYQNVGLTPNTIYCYLIVAYDGAGNNSINSPQSCATTPTGADTTAPSVPTGLVATAITSTRIDLSWNASSDTGGSGIKGYKVYRNGVQINTTTATTYSNTGGLAPNTSYTYTVAAYDNSGNTSAQSTGSTATTLADTTAPSVPTGVVASSTQGNTNIVTWNASVDSGGSGVATYRIYTNAVLLTTSTSRTYTHTGLAYNTQYCYTIAALDNAGNVSAQSLQSCATTPAAAADTTAPSVPGSLSATVVSSTQIDLTWSTSTDSGGSGLAGYKIFRGGVQIATRTTASYSNTGLTPGTQYCYTVQAYDNAGNSSASSTQDCATTTADTASGAFQWVHGFSGSASGDDSVAAATATDSAGNVITVGRLRGNVNFGDGIVRSSTGGNASADIYIVKLSSQGVFQWVKTIGSNYQDWASGVAVNSSDEIIVTGTIGSSFNFSGTDLTFGGVQDIFLAKFSSAGTLSWVKSFGSTGADYGISVAVDGSNNIILGAELAGSGVDFGTGAISQIGSFDGAVAKFDTAGTCLWSKSFGGTSEDRMQSVSVDTTGAVLACGYFQGTANFGGGAIASAGNYDGYLVKFASANGAYQWANTFGSTLVDSARAVAVDPVANDIVMTGAFTGSVDFGSGTVSSGSNRAMFVASYSSAGVCQWVNHYGGSYLGDSGQAVAVNSNGDISVTGSIVSGIMLGSQYVTGNGSANFFVLGLSNSGGFRWGRRLKTAGFGNGIAYGPSGSTICVGSTNPVNVDFGGGPTTFGAGTATGFIVSYGP